MVTEDEWARLVRVAILGARRWRDESVTEEAAQDTLLALLAALGSGRRIRDLEAWVAVKSYWRAKGLSRADSRRRVREIRSASLVSTGPSVDVPASLLDLDQRPLKETVARRLSGMTIREIASETGTSRSAVQRQLNAVRKQLSGTGREGSRKAR